MADFLVKTIVNYIANHPEIAQQVLEKLGQALVDHFHKSDSAK